MRIGGSAPPSAWAIAALIVYRQLTSPLNPSCWVHFVPSKATKGLASDDLRSVHLQEPETEKLFERSCSE